MYDTVNTIEDRWFPKEKWSELHKVWTGLGQIFRDKKKGQGLLFLECAYQKAQNPLHPFTHAEYERLEKIARCYHLTI
jgi:hypothetical protein